MPLHGRPAESERTQTDVQQPQLVRVQFPTAVLIHGVEQFARCLYPRRIFDARQLLALELSGIPEKGKAAAAVAVESVRRGTARPAALRGLSHLLLPQHTERSLLSIQKTRGCFSFPVAM